MRIVKQASLYFREGTSDKVYEVALLQVGEDEFVVNFQYGRRGAALREGTKTVFPVPLAEAEKVFNKLIAEKKGKGYQVSNESASATTTSAVEPEDVDAMEEVVLKYLKEAAQGIYDEEQWKLSRVIWRAGELKLKKAEPALLALKIQQDEFFPYALAWALGRCGSEASTKTLLDLQKGSDKKVVRIATVALCRVGDAAAKSEQFNRLEEEIPGMLKDTLQTGNTAGLHKNLHELLYELKTTRNDYLFNLYLLGLKYDFLPPVLKEVVAELPLKPAYFQQLRYILKAAELLEDEVLYATISARIDKKEAFFKQSNWGGAWLGGEYVNNATEELKKADSRAAYSNKTRAYLQRRAVRMLSRMGESHDPKFTHFAREILLNFSDEDDKGVGKKVDYQYDWNTRRSTVTTTYFPSLSEYPLAGLLLYKGGSRFEMSAGSMRIQYVALHTPEQPAPPQREEAFPSMWDKAPEDLVAILENAESRVVNEFAVKAFKANPSKEEFISPQLIKSLLNKKYTASNELGLELAKKAYDPAKPDVEMLFALLDCPLEDAQELGLSWIAEKQQQFLQSQPFLVHLLLAKQPKVNQWAKTQLAPHIIPAALVKPILEEVLQTLATLSSTDTEEEEEAVNSYIAQVSDLVFIVFHDAVKEVPSTLLENMLQNRLEKVQELAVKILLRKESTIQNLSDSLFDALINSPFATVRALGVNLFGKLPEHTLYDRREVLVNFCISPHPEVRQQALPIMTVLLKNRSSFGKELIQLFVPFMWRKEAYEGLHMDLLALIQQALKPFHRDISEEWIWKLIQTDYRAAHILGSQLLKEFVALDRLPLEKIVKLGNHELKELRDLVQQYFEEHVSRVKYEPEATLKLLDSKWDDTRQFGKQFLQKHFSMEDWTPELLVSICDHNREEIQQFGLGLITQHFQEENGVDYMLKLSQHPNTDLQLFVTNYLSRYATGNTERIREMDHYFTSVLLQVNQGRVAKERVYHFLRKEAMISEEVAAWAIPLISRVSLTIAIKDKATCIQLLADLKKQYPQLNSPIAIKEFKTV